MHCLRWTSGAQCRCFFKADFQQKSPQKTHTQKLQKKYQTNKFWNKITERWGFYFKLTHSQGGKGEIAAKLWKIVEVCGNCRIIAGITPPPQGGQTFPTSKKRAHTQTPLARRGAHRCPRSRWRWRPSGWGTGRTSAPPAAVGWPPPRPPPASPPARSTCCPAGGEAAPEKSEIPNLAGILGGQQAPWAILTGDDLGWLAALGAAECHAWGGGEDSKIHRFAQLRVVVCFVYLTFRPFSFLRFLIHFVLSSFIHLLSLLLLSSFPIPPL